MTNFEIIFNVGDEVILGEHEGNNRGVKNWDPEMIKFVGRQAKIIQMLSYKDGSQSFLYYVDIDHGMWAWRGANMTLVKSIKEVIKAPEVYGAKCIKCFEYNNYVLASDNFMCYSCKH